MYGICMVLIGLIFFIAGNITNAPIWAILFFTILSGITVAGKE